MLVKKDQTSFHKDLKKYMDQYVHFIYNITQNFPKDEQFGVTSQIRRASLSVILNYIEGFARKKKAVMNNFFEISYGSLKESKYLLYFSYKRSYLSFDRYKKGLDLAEIIGKMSWGILEKLEVKS